jgi:cob(I)alamin adenosyltransferase
MGTKIYTGTGDRGKTGLFSGERVSKGDSRIEAYGDVDELNSVLGAVRAALPEGANDARVELEGIQSTLFRIGARLATAIGSPSASVLPEVTLDDTTRLEAAVDRMDGQLPPLGGFILPGGRAASAWSHVARAVCRRAERNVVRLAEQMEVPESLRAVVVYLNRLSDFLFVLARYCNHLQGEPDQLWEK